MAILISLSAAAAAQAGRHHQRTARIVKPMAARECLARAMYFESNRTAEDGMLAVGTVVANRLASGRYGATVCNVVGERRQFAPGVLSRPMSERQSAALAMRVAEAVLGGGRHPAVGGAMFFHTANVPFRHDDKRYVTVAGGNAFYQWSRGAAEGDAQSLGRALAAAESDRQEAKRVFAALGTPVAPLPVSRDEPIRSDAVAKVAAAQPATSPARRVITPTAPIYAALGPVFRSPAPEPFTLPAPRASPIASLVVAQAWSSFR